MTESTSTPDGPADDDDDRVRFRSMPGAIRYLTYAVVGLLALSLVLTIVTVVLVRRPFPQVSGEIDVPGLTGSVEVIRDGHGIPQLYGDNVLDLMMAQGYVHAQERFFEMDIRRHITAGRLSEIFGETTVETDQYIRTMDWRGVAEKELALLRPDTRDALDAYADGVNAYLSRHSSSNVAFEYTLLKASGLDYEPEAWTPLDSLTWLKAMAWDLRGNLDDEIARTLALVDHTPEQVAQLYPEYDATRAQPIVGQGAVIDGVFEQDATGSGTRLPERPAPAAVDALRRIGQGLSEIPQLLGHGDGIGSNSWVVDGEHTDTGLPILANDPHLGVSLPGIWMQMGLHCRTVTSDCPLDVAGFTFSGVPGVIIGHNADVAWGFTNLGPDVSDLFLERIVGDQWEQDGRLKDLVTRQETVKVRGAPDVTFTVRSTKHGPLLSDVSEELRDVADGAAEEEVAVSLSWTALTPSRTADAILDLNRATDWTSFREAAEQFAVPAQNLVYADREGHIGYQAPGMIPIRKSGNDGALPQEGWLSENDWTGDYIPFDGLPNVLDPDEGFVVTANQQVIGADYPFFLTDDWDHGYRSQRIRDLVEAGSLSVDDMARIQVDDLNPMAATLVPYLLDVGLPRGYYSAGQRLLAEWDFHQGIDSAAGEYYNVVWRQLLALAFHDELVEEQWPDGGDRWMAAVTGLLEDPSNAWWDDRETTEVETRDDILVAAMKAARQEITKLDDRDTDGWAWGHLHQLDLHNQTLGESGVGPVEWLLNRNGWQVGGGGALVNATAWDAADGYVVTSAPSMRMVVSLADFDASRWINLTGVSGHAFNAHYTDQTDLWARGETLPWVFSPTAVADAEEETLILRPASE